MTLSDPRFLSLTDWLCQHFNTPVLPRLISGDASFRRYYRVQYLSVSYIAVDSPPNLVPIEPFVDLASVYQERGVNVPQVIAQHADMGFMLLSDLGDIQLLSQLTDDNVVTHYQQALDLLPHIAQVTATKKAQLPDYDRAFLVRELGIFTEWLLDKYLSLSRDADTSAMIDDAFAVLIENALSQPQVGMHRDFHSRNLMLHDNRLWVIDFQDAVLGPVTYDAVSLLRDCYVRWPDAVVEQLSHYHYQQCLQLQVIDKKVSYTQYQRWFDLMGLQRHIKAAGIFVRLNLRDHKMGYMADIPLTLTYILDIAARYPELTAFSRWIAATVIPAFKAKQ